MDQPPPQFNNGMPQGMVQNQAHWGQPQMHQPQMQMQQQTQPPQPQAQFNNFSQVQNSQGLISF